MAAKLFTCTILLIIVIHCEGNSFSEWHKCSRRVIDLTHVLNENAPRKPLATIEMTDEDFYKLTLLRENYWGPGSDKWYAKIVL